MKTTAYLKTIGLGPSEMHVHVYVNHGVVANGYTVYNPDSILCLPRHYHNYDIPSGGEITPCIKIDEPLVVYRFW